MKSGHNAWIGTITKLNVDVITAPRFALEANTELALENASGSVIASNEDINAAALYYRSCITATLTPLVYYVAVTGLDVGTLPVTARVRS